MKSRKIQKTLMNIICTLLAVSLLLLTCACHAKPKPPVSAINVLQAMLSVAAPPDGMVRSLTAENDNQVLPLDLLTALYGPSTRQWYEDGARGVLDDGAVFLSTAMHPFEIAVFRCIDQGDILGGMASVFGICSARLDMIKNAWKKTDYASYTEKGMVTYVGNYVLLIMCDNPDDVIKAAEKAIRK